MISGKLGRDLSDPRWLFAKAAGFVAIAIFSLTLIFIFTFSIKLCGLAMLACWASARSYYFCFYFVENYIDPKFRFAGLASVVRHLIFSRKESIFHDKSAPEIAKIKVDEESTGNSSDQS